MLRSTVLRRLTAAALCAAFAVYSSSCGTILHPERVGQPRCGRIDPAIAVLDGVGLLLFFFPGAIAFAVDFYTGAIFLPPHACYDPACEGPRDDEVSVLYLDPDELTPDRIEREIRERTGHIIRFTPGDYEVARLNRLEDLDDSTRQLAARERGTGPSAVIFRCQSE
jgi:hypothetical protein